MKRHEILTDAIEAAEAAIESLEGRRTIGTDLLRRIARADCDCESDEMLARRHKVGFEPPRSMKQTILGIIHLRQHQERWKFELSGAVPRG